MIQKIIDKYPFYATTLIFGVLGAINAFLFFFFLIANQIYPFSVVYGIVLLINIVFNVLGIIYYRYLLRQYEFHFWQGLSVGFLINIVMVGMYCLLVFLFLSHAFSDFLNIYIKVEQEKFLLDKAIYLQNINEQQFNEMYKAIEQIKLGKIIFRLLETSGMLGTFVVFVASILLRRKVKIVVETVPKK
jgi:hypothetical protein